jgi:hypothetical protein
MELCEYAATEKDPTKLMRLIEEITTLLEARDRRLNDCAPATTPNLPTDCFMRPARCLHFYPPVTITDLKRKGAIWKTGASVFLST